MIYKDPKSPLQRTHETLAALAPDEYEIIPIAKYIVDAVDSLVEIAKEKASRTGFVETESDWQVIEAIFKIWVATSPAEYKQFAKSQVDARKGLYNSMSVTKERGGASMQHQLNLPFRFDAMFRAIYPRQKWDKKFITKIAKRLPILKVPERF